MRTCSMIACLLLAALPACSSVDNDPNGDPADDPPEDIDLGPSKSRWSFELPSEGTPNDNGHIGPFCCTGVTAVVQDDGPALAYAYYFGWEGQAVTDGKSSWMPDFSVPISATTNLDADPTVAKFEESEIAFTAGEVFPGFARSARVGALYFTVTIEHASVVQSSEGPMVEMDVAARLDVDPIE